MRLDKYLSNSTDLSRSQVKRLLRNKQVTVNDKLQTDGASIVADDDRVRLNGEAVETPGKRYFMFHKPEGVVSVSRDSERPTAIDYLSEPRPELLQIAGRLDIDATGLLLITDDGPWNHRVTAPRTDCYKTYQVELANPVTGPEQSRWAGKCQRGLWLEGEKRRTLPAELTFLDHQRLELRICEGKYHQVKRMCAALGNRVVALHRQAVGQIVLDPGLQPGEYRALSQQEIASIK